MFTGIAVTVLIVLTCIWIISASVHNYYYRSMFTSLETKATTASEFFSTYVTHTYAEFYQTAYRYAEGFEERDRIELQFLTPSGHSSRSRYGRTG